MAFTCGSTSGLTTATLLDMARPGLTKSGTVCGGSGIVSVDAPVLGEWSGDGRLVMSSHRPLSVEYVTPVEWGASRLGTGAAVWVDEGGVALMTTSDTTGPHSSDSGRVSVRYLRVGAGGHLTVDGGVHVVSDSDVVIAGTVLVGWNVTLEASNNVTLQVRPSLGARVACLSELSLAKRPW